ncbi:aminotransferase-like domain-containing protein [Aliigemmobacter aestuarii]|nr:PLP-dependent aminotransferase family protein [Gemmobacter aestuarii]
MDTNWTPDLSRHEGPKYLALVRALREGIRQGELPPGTQVPTVRDLAWRIKVTPGTVARAYHIATQEGLLDATVGRGTFVADTGRRFGPSQSLFIERVAIRDANMMDLRSPRLPDVGQVERIAEALRQAADSAGPEWMGYPSQHDEFALRAALCDWIGERDLGPVSPDDLALTHGGQSAINLVFQCCLRGDRPLILIEELAYPGFRHAARLNRADIAGIEMDDHGLRPDALDAACRKSPAQILCLTCEGQNPTTLRMPAERRAEIAEVARRHDLQIIDDECYGPEGDATPGMRAFAPERTWHVGSLSKTVSPALRFGYVFCPRGMGEAGRMTAQHGFFALAKPMSDAILNLLQSGAAAQIRADVRAETNLRLSIATRAFDGFDLHWRADLPYVWLRLPNGWRASTFARMAEGQGVLVRSADEFALFNGRPPHAVRIALAGDTDPDLLARALDRLSTALRHPPEDVAV